MDTRTKMERNIDQVLGLLDQVPDGDPSEQKEIERTGMEVVEYQPVESAVTITDEMSGEEQDRIEDYQFARTVSHRLIEKGISALELAMVLAKESEHPRTFDTINSLIQTISTTSTNLMNLHKKPSVAKPSQAAQTINNTQIINQNTKDNSVKDINDVLDALPGGSDEQQ